MFRKVNAKERIVGFYSTGPQIRSNDLRIYDIVERYTSGKNTTSTTSNSGSGTVKSSSSSSLPTYPAIFSIIDVRPDRSDLPVTSYTVTEQINSTSSKNNNKHQQQQPTMERIFVHVPTTLGAVEAEEVGVEHLLRDIHDPTISTIASLIQEKVTGLQTLHSKLLVCQQYIQSCITNNNASGATATSNADGTNTSTTTTTTTIAPINPTILSNLQTIVSLLPNTIAITDQLHHRSMMEQTNDMYMSMYIAALIRTVMAIHDLIQNQIQYGNVDNDHDNNDTTTKADLEAQTKNDGKLLTNQEEKKE
jgi:26S proteasome regulatory subunit N8